MNELNYTLVKLSIGQVGLVWTAGKRPRVLRIFLPDDRVSTEFLITRSFPAAAYGVHFFLDEICRQLEEYDRGKDVRFSLYELELNRWGEFCQKVWTETCNIPRGKVSAYGELAKRFGCPGAARATGTALGKNPFPLIIPCHRVIYANGELGGFSGGGTTMKRRLLEKEGVIFNSRGRVLYSDSPSTSTHSPVFIR